MPEQYLSLNVSLDIAQCIIATASSLIVRSKVPFRRAVADALEGTVTSEVMDIYSDRTDLFPLFRRDKYGYLNDPKVEDSFIQSVKDLLADRSFVLGALEDWETFTPAEQETLWLELEKEGISACQG